MPTRALQPVSVTSSESTVKTSCSPGGPYVSRQSSVGGLRAGCDARRRRRRRRRAGACAFEASTKPANVAPSAMRTMIVVRLTPRDARTRARAGPRGRGGRLARALDLHEYQGKELFRRYGIPVSDGRLATSPAEARAAAEELGGPVVVKAQVLIGRARQGRRHQARGDAGRGRGARARDPRHGHPRPRRHEGLDRARLRHRARVLPLAHVRPQREEAALHVHDAGRHRHRGGRRDEPGRARPAPRRSARGLSSVARAAARLRRRRRPIRASRSRSRRSSAKLYDAFVGDGGDALRDQPADRHARRRGAGARLEVHRRRQRALPAPGHRRDARRRRPPIRSRRSRARRASRT